MRLLLRVFGPADAEYPIRFASVELRRPEIERILTRMDHVTQAKTTDDALTQHIYRGGVRWSAESLSIDLADEIDDKEVIRCNKPFQREDYDDPDQPVGGYWANEKYGGVADDGEVATEGDRQHVSAGYLDYPAEVYWSAYWKHTDVQVYTARLNRDFLQELLNELTAND